MPGWHQKFVQEYQSYDILQVCECGFCYHIEVLRACILQVCKSDARGRRQVKCGLCIDVFILKRWFNFGVGSA
jgi:hypothetical protein